MKILWMLTATVTPGAHIGHLALRQSDKRLCEYQKALSFWLNETRQHGHDVLLIENSEFPAALWYANLSIRDRCRLHVLSYRSGVSDVRGGKGAGEAEMLDRLKAWLEEDGHVYDLIAKVTGRLRVVNAIKALPPGVTNDEVVCRFSSDLRQVDTRFFAFTPDVLRNRLCGLGPSIDEPSGVYLEHVVARSVRQGIDDGLHRREFQRSPVISGSSGSTGHMYSGPGRYLRAWVQTAATRYGPKFG